MGLSICAQGWRSQAVQGQGAAARARVGSPTPDFLPAWWLLRTVLHSPLLFTFPSPPSQWERSCLPHAGVPLVTRRLGCHTGSQQAGALGLGTRKPGWGSQGNVVRAEELTAAREGVERLSVVPNPCPHSSSSWDLLGQGTWCQVPPREVQLLRLLPSWLPPNVGSRWLGEALDPCFRAIDTPLQNPGAGLSLPREGISLCRHLRMRARFLLFFR